jgi:hypothetical protein
MTRSTLLTKRWSLCFASELLPGHFKETLFQWTLFPSMAYIICCLLPLLRLKLIRDDVISNSYS